MVAPAGPAASGSARAAAATAERIVRRTRRGVVPRNGSRAIVGPPSAAHRIRCQGPHGPARAPHHIRARPSLARLGGRRGVRWTPRFRGSWRQIVETRQTLLEAMHLSAESETARWMQERGVAL